MSDENDQKYDALSVAMTEALKVRLAEWSFSACGSDSESSTTFGLTEAREYRPLYRDSHASQVAMLSDDGVIYVKVDVLDENAAASDEDRVDFTKAVMNLDEAIWFAEAILRLRDRFTSGSKPGGSK